MGVLRTTAMFTTGLEETEKELLLAPTCTPPCVSLPATKRRRELDKPKGALKKVETDGRDTTPTSASGRG